MQDYIDSLLIANIQQYLIAKWKRAHFLCMFQPKQIILQLKYIFTTILKSINIERQSLDWCTIKISAYIDTRSGKT